MRTRARVDANHVEIATAFRQAGWSVLSLASVGKGCPDLLVQHPAVDDLYLVEVKTKAGKLTADQARFQQAFTVKVIRSVDDVQALIEGESRASGGGRDQA